MAKKTLKTSVEQVPTIVLEKPKQKKAPAKAKRRPKLTGARLLELAEKHKPPQSWYEEDLDGI